MLKIILGVQHMGVNSINRMIEKSNRRIDAIDEKLLRLNFLKRGLHLL